MHIRPETEDDEAAIRALLLDAFDGPAEADLVDALRWQGDLAISLIAEEEGHLVGHVALSRLKSPRRALALAPLAVAANAQHRGIGTALVKAALDAAAARDTAIIFVLGDPAYYVRFGFTLAAADIFPSVYSGEHFMSRWTGAARIAPAPVLYAEAFESLGA